MSGREDRMAADQASRRLAQSEFERSVVVVAGAGTGKTALLVSRVVVWCVGRGWDRHAIDGSDRASVARRVIERVVAKGLDSSALRVDEIMSKPVITASPSHSLQECAAMLARADIRRLLVYDGQEIVGIVSSSDIFGAL